jgi:hypothetical protein
LWKDQILQNAVKCRWWDTKEQKMEPMLSQLVTNQLQLWIVVSFSAVNYGSEMQ